MSCPSVLLWLASAAGFFLPALTLGQETERALRTNVRLHGRGSVPDAGDRGGGNSLLLPFFDDFSRYSLPADDPDLPADWQRWSDAAVYINSVLPVSPPTIGVATLDGLNAQGYPRDFTDEYAQGPSDTLTSLPLDLSGYTADDQVYLTFSYQPGGNGNNPDEEDSLVVDFYSPFGAGGWFRAWSVPGSPSAAFQQVFLPVDAPEYLLDGFRFRFRNYATLSGAFDHWHIDYVIVREGIDPNDFEFDEVAMQYPNSTLLDKYTAMPWTHYQSDPASFMAATLEAFERNLGPTENIVTGYSVRYQDQLDEFPDEDFNTFGNGFQEFSRTLELDGYVFDPAVNDSCAEFEVSVFVSPTDLNLQNDTARFTQTFSNYYAYDDGSAERAYAVEAAGASVAVKFFAEVPDSLLGVMIHWVPYGVDVSDQTFLLRAWGDAGGQPGSELMENFIFHAPRFYEDGPDVFSYYPFDEPVWVDGNFYVGWTQPGAIGLNVGNDKNTDTNPVRLFYRLGIGQSWQQSAITGSVMIRPVFRAGKEDEWTTVPEVPGNGFSLYPNPVSGHLFLNTVKEEMLELRMHDLSGREVFSETFRGGGVYRADLSALPAGAYVAHVYGAAGEFLGAQTIIRQ